jgi:hypothetical protein
MDVGIRYDPAKTTAYVTVGVNRGRLEVLSKETGRIGFVNEERPIESSHRGGHSNISL